MASFMPAACSPCAIDQAIERLLATPNTTAFRPCKSEDMSSPCEFERISAPGSSLPRSHGCTAGKLPGTRSQRGARSRSEYLRFFLLEISRLQPRCGRAYATANWLRGKRAHKRYQG